MTLDATDPTLPEWRTKLEEARLGELQNIRAIAEKWTGTVTALIGAFAAVSVVLGPKTLKDFTNHDLAIASAGAALIAGLTGLGAVGVAIYAAQGWPFVDRTMDAATYKRKAIEKAGSAATLLVVSRVLASIATLAVLSVGLMSATDTVFLKGDSGVFLIVIHEDGKANCIQVSGLAAELGVVRTEAVAHC